MKNDTILKAATQQFGQGGYEYGDVGKKKSRSGGDNDRDGKKEVDCSFLVATALKNAGFNLGVNPAAFTTRSLFQGNMLKTLAHEKFDSLPASSVFDSKQLQKGDLILFKSKTGSGQHIGIFDHYDSNGKAVFFGSQSSTGPAFTSVGDKKSYWGGKGFEIVGALRAKAEHFAPSQPHTPSNAPSNVQTSSRAAPTTAATPSTPSVAVALDAMVKFLKSPGVEGYRAGIYSDSVGVPTVGNGFALVVKGGNGWVVRSETEIKQLFKQAGIDQALYNSLPHKQLELAAQYKQVGNNAAAAALFGDGKSPKPKEFQLNTQQADALSAAFLSRYVLPKISSAFHTTTDALLSKLTVGESVAIASRLYQWPEWLNTEKGKQFVKTFETGEKAAANHLLSDNRGLRGKLEAKAFSSEATPQLVQSPKPNVKEQPIHTIALAGGATLSNRLDEQGAVRDIRITDAAGKLVFSTTVADTMNIDPKTGVVQVALSNGMQGFEYEPKTGFSAWSQVQEDGSVHRSVFNAQGNPINTTPENASKVELRMA